MKKKAVMTVELSLLMPGIIAVLIFIIYLGYYFHDRCVMERGIYHAALRGSYDSVKSETSIHEYFEDEVSERLIGKWNLCVSVHITEDEIITDVRGNMDLLEGVFSSYLSKVFFNVDMSESVICLNEPSYITRKYNERRRGDEY